MIEPNEAQGLTRKEMVQATGCAPYLVAYYGQCGYLPIIKPSTGPGDPVLFDAAAIEIIKERMSRKQRMARSLEPAGG